MRISTILIAVILFGFYGIGYGQTNSLDFDGVDDYISITGYKGVTGTNSRTVEAYVKIPVGATGHRAIVSWGINAASQKWIVRMDNATGALRVEVNGGFSIGSTNLRDGTWHHVAVTWANDGTPDVLDAKLYVDGILETVSSSLPEPINTAIGVDVRIGVGHNNFYFLGNIDEVRIWNDVRTQAEILNNMCNIANPSTETNLVSYYKFDQIAGSNLPDLKSTNDGTLMNMTNSDWVAGIVCMPRVYDSSTTTQTNTNEIEKCVLQNEQMIGVEIVATGNQSVLDITQFIVETTGSTNPIGDITNINLYYTGTSPVFDTTTLFGSALPASTGVNIPINGMQSLATGTNYFWVTYNISPSATIGNVVDAVCNQVTVNASSYVPAITTPAGSRTIIDCPCVNIYLDGVILADTVTLACGGSLDLLAVGILSPPVLVADFNTGTLGSGWSTSVSLSFDNPCTPPLDGTSSAWFGYNAWPRTLTTNPYDVSCGGEVCFELDFGSNENMVFPYECESPDVLNEGVYFQYSIDAGATWVNIFYFSPPGWNTAYGQYSNWANYCFSIPPAAWSIGTIFRLTQLGATGTDNDHWGIDNFTIYPSSCSNLYDWDHIAGAPDAPNQTVSPTATTTYSVLYTDGVSSCRDTITIDIVPDGQVFASALDTILCPTSSTQLGSFLVNSNIPVPSGACALSTTPCVGPVNEFIVQASPLNAPNHPTSYNDSYFTRMQMLYRADELLSAGVVPGNITELSFNVIDKTSTQPFTNLSIKMGCVSDPMLIGISYNVFPTSTVLFSPSYSTTLGWNTHTFDTPYVWDGVSNIVVEICIFNPSTTGIDKVAKSLLPYYCTRYSLKTYAACNLIGVINGKVFRRPDTRFGNCATTTVPLSNYVWTPSTNLSNPNSANPTVSSGLSATTTYTVTAFDPFNPGCSVTDSVTLHVNKVDAGPDLNICTDGEIQLNATGTSECSDSGTYSWTPSLGLNDPNIANPIASPAVSTTYIVTWNDDSCANCLVYDTVNVIVGNISSSPVMTSTPVFCLGTEGTASATPVGMVAPISYSWNTTPAQGTPTAIGLTTGNYTITLTDSSGCIATNNVNVTNSIISAGFAPPVAQCISGNDFTFVNTGTTGAGISSAWYFGDGIGTSTVENPIYSYTSAGTYTVTQIVNIGFCADTFSFPVTIYATPMTALGGNTSFCSGDSIALDPGIFTSYLWSTGENTQTIDVATAIEYFVTVTDLNGCTVSDSTLVAENISPTPSVIGDLIVCQGDTSILNAGSYTSYIWSTTDTTQTIGISAIGNYSVTVTDSNGCQGTDAFSTQLAGGSIISNVMDTLICVGDSTQLGAAFSFPPSYSFPAGCFTIAIPCSDTINTVVVGGGGSGPVPPTLISPYAGGSDGKVQIIYRANDLLAAGLVQGNITELSFNVLSKSSTLPFNDFTIKMGCASLDQYSWMVSAFLPVSSTVYYSSAVTTALGWNDYPLSIPYYWDGISNIIVEVCFDNASNGGWDIISTSYIGYNSAIQRNVSGGSSCTYIGTGYSTFTRPIIKLKYCSYDPIIYEWTPTTYLSDSTVLNPMVNGLPATTTYTVTALDPNYPGCPVSSSVTIDVGCVVLPIELSSFSAISECDRVRLDWVTASEMNNDYFTIEKSRDGINWSVLTTVDGAGVSISESNYQSIDINPYSETSYYRLKQTDFDGEFEYFSTVAIVQDCKGEGFITNIFPNPTNAEFSFTSNFGSSNTLYLEMFNSLGQLVLAREFNSSGTGEVDASSLESGVYTAKFKLGTKIEIHKIVISK